MEMLPSLSDKRWLETVNPVLLAVVQRAIAMKDNNLRETSPFGSYIAEDVSPFSSYMS